MHEFLSLGPTPLANSFLKENQLNSPEAVYPLDVYFCKHCELVQLVDVVPPEILFKNYIYVSGTSNTMRSHFTGLAGEVFGKSKLSVDSLVVDIGSNDGTLLKSFRAFKVKTLGVEPASNLAKLAEDEGIETVNDFFNEKTALEIMQNKGKANAVMATNVFAHIQNLDEFLRGIDILLDDGGVFVIEIPYLLDLLEKMLFDTIYHEHLSYFAVSPLVTLFKRFDMEMFDVKRISVHGGSIRVYVRKSPSSSSESVAKLVQLERHLHLDSLPTYLSFATEVARIRAKLVRLLKHIKAKRKRIAGYGAPAKGNTLLNYCRLGTDTLDYIVDENPYKQGLYTPGMRIPVFPTKKIGDDRPDYVLLLAWNYSDEILQREQKYRERGGKFILPIPDPQIV